MEKLRVALVGLNQYSHARHIYKVIKRRTDIFEVAGVVLPEGEEEKYANQMWSVNSFPRITMEEALNDPTIEAFVIETDEIHLTKYALMAAEHGKHIHMEKPGGVSLQDFKKLIAIMKKNNKIFHTGYMYRYNPYVEEAMQKIKSGELGNIISVEAQMNGYLSADMRQWLQNFPGGMMFYLGCHMVDVILQIQGKPKRIIPLNKCTDEGVTSEDFGMAVLEYENGVSFAKTNALELGGFARRQIVVTGTKGTIEIKPLEIRTQDDFCYPRKTVYTSEDWNDMGDVTECEPFNRYEGTIVAFAEYVKGEKENPYTYDYEEELFETVLKCCNAEH